MTNFEKYKLTQRSYQAELMDDPQLGNEALRKNLDEIALINTWLGGNKVLTKALDYLSKKNILTVKEKIHLADLGAGGGDNLRVMAKWFRKKGITAELTGIDFNDFMLDYARQKTADFPEISYAKQDIFSGEFQAQDYELVSMSLFCHHFTDTQLIELFAKLYNEVGKVVIINDLHRNPLAYHSIKLLTKLGQGSYLVQHDAPLSVQRAFVRSDFANLLRVAGVPYFEIRWIWAFRFQVLFGKALRG